MKREPNDQIEIKTYLTQAQCDALAAEAKANGAKFFEHCRSKLLAGITTQVTRLTIEPEAIKDRNMLHIEKEPNRLDRLEEAVMNMTRLVQGVIDQAGKMPPQIIEDEPPMAEDPSIDVDELVSGSLAEADRRPQAVERQTPQQQDGVRHMGTRRPMPFSVGAQPHHLRQG